MEDITIQTTFNYFLYHRTIYKYENSWFTPVFRIANVIWSWTQTSVNVLWIQLLATLCTCCTIAAFLCAVFSLPITDFDLSDAIYTCTNLHRHTILKCRWMLSTWIINASMTLIRNGHYAYWELDIILYEKETWTFSFQILFTQIQVNSL